MDTALTPQKNETQITLQISNFNLKDGGPIKEIVIGDVDLIRTQNLNWQSINLILIGLIFSMGLYHLVLYMLLEKYISPLYFGIFCCVISLRTALTNDRILHVLCPGIGWEILLKLEYLTFYLSVPVFVLYIASLFPKESSRWILILINIFSAAASAFVIFFPPTVFSHTLTAYQIFTILAGFYLIHLFSQAYLLSLKFSKALKRVEKQKNEIIESHKQFQNSRIALILGLAKLAEYRDEDTGSHLERIWEYANVLAIGLSKKEEYTEYISQDYIDDLYQSSILHDIGKIGIPDAVLLKPGKLTEEEFDIIKTHATIGGDAISAIESNSKVRSFLTLGRNIAYYHHEKWNGKGYPKGLKGHQTPLSARIVAIADVYDALTSERPYKKAFSHEKSVEIILQDSGTHFDPDIIEVFKKLAPQFQRIRKNYFE